MCLPDDRQASPVLVLCSVGIKPRPVFLPGMHSPQLSYMLLPSLKSVTICVKVLVNADLVALSFCLIIFSTAFAMLIWLLYF